MSPSYQVPLGDLLQVLDEAAELSPSEEPVDELRSLDDERTLTVGAARRALARYLLERRDCS